MQTIIKKKKGKQASIEKANSAKKEKSCIKLGKKKDTKK